jgi:hypothetical protein
MLDLVRLLSNPCNSSVMHNLHCLGEKRMGKGIRDVSLSGDEAAAASFVALLSMEGPLFSQFRVRTANFCLTADFSASCMFMHLHPMAPSGPVRRILFYTMTHHDPSLADYGCHTSSTPTTSTRTLLANAKPSSPLSRNTLESRAA